MNQIEAFTLIADQLARDFLLDHTILPTKRVQLRKAYRVLEQTINRRSIAKSKRDREERLITGE